MRHSRRQQRWPRYRICTGWMSTSRYPRRPAMRPCSQRPAVLHRHCLLCCLFRARWNGRSAMLHFFDRALSGNGGKPWFGIGRGSVEAPDQFASWLPYGAYVADDRMFVNRHHSLGFLLELIPQAGADERMVEVLQSLYASCPANTGVQFHLFGSPDVHGPLLAYANLRMEDVDQAGKAAQWGRPARNDNLYRQMARRRVGHLFKGSQQSLTRGFHFTVRDFRLMMSVSCEGRADDPGKYEAAVGLRDSMASTLL